MSDTDLGWLADVLDTPVLSSAEPTHRVFMRLLRDLIALHPHTRDVFDRPSGPRKGFGCRCCHTDEYEFTEGLGWCPTIRQIAVQNGITLPDNPDTPALAITEEYRAMTTPAPIPQTFQAPPAEQQPAAPYPPAAAPAPAPAPAPANFQAPPAFQAAPVPQPQPAPAPAPAAAEPLAAVASAALQAEAAPTTAVAPPQAVAITYGGHVYSVPAERDKWPLSVLEALEDDKLTIAARGLLGPRQWARFTATNPLTGDMGKLWQAIGQAVGFEDLGE